MLAKSEASKISKARNIGIKLGSGELIGFIDAHCVPDPNWLANMVGAFQDSRVGGCQGNINHTYDSLLVKAISLDSRSDSRDYWWEYTLSGENTAFPFIGTGNAMFRREAVEAVGLFDEALNSSEDVDLSWKILLLGYELTAVDNANVTHISPHSLRSYFRKYFNHGIASATLVYTYQLKRKQKLAEPRNTLKSVPLTDLIYFLVIGLNLSSFLCLVPTYPDCIITHRCPSSSVHIVTGCQKAGFVCPKMSFTG